MAQIVAGTPYWTSVNPIPSQYPYLADDIDCDVAVIGAGVTGALCAYELAKSGVSTVLVDAGLIGYGSTSVCSSTVQYELEDGLSCLKKMIGLEKAIRAYKATARGVEELKKTAGELDEDVGFQPRDCFCYTPDPADVGRMTDEYLLRRHNGFPVELYDSMKSADKFSFRVEAGIYTTGLAGEIDPYKFTHALVAAAVKKGLRVFENTSIVNTASSNGAMELETKTRHRIRCRKVVNAAGSRAAGKAGCALSSRTSFCVVTEPVAEFRGWQNRCILHNEDDPSLFLRTTADNRILIGGMSGKMIDGQGTFAGLVKIPSLAQNKYSQLEQKLASMFTGIEGIRAHYRFSGAFSVSPDGLPYIGERPGQPNILYALCGGPSGIVFGILAAQMIRGLYFGEKSPDEDLFALDR